MNYKIFSNIPCVAKIKEEAYELNETNYLELDEESAIYLYPLVKGYLPKIIKFNDPSIKKIRYKDTFLIFPEFLVVPSGEISLCKAFGNKMACLTGIPYKFTISSEDKCFTYSIQKELKLPEIISIAGAPCVSAEVSGKSYLLIFDGTDFIELLGEIEIDKSKIKALTDLQTSSHHGELSEISVSMGKTSVQTDLVYLDSKPRLKKSTAAKNYAFLEAVKLKDLNLARTFLSDKLNEKLDDKHLEKFFGKFDSILPLSQNEFCIINKSTPLRVLEFKNSNGKIVDVN